jgi:hypothetical protein
VRTSAMNEVLHYAVEGGEDPVETLLQLIHMSIGTNQ